MQLRSATVPESHLPDHQTTRTIIGAFYYVYNSLGYGFPESVYDRALAAVFARTQVSVQRQVPISVRFEGVDVGEFRLDLVVASRVVVELKAVERLHPVHDAQVVSYLRASGLAIGLLLNFGPKAEYRRLIFTGDGDNRQFPRRNSG